MRKWSLLPSEWDLVITLKTVTLSTSGCCFERGWWQQSSEINGRNCAKCLVNDGIINWVFMREHKCFHSWKCPPKKTLLMLTHLRVCIFRCLQLSSTFLRDENTFVMNVDSGLFNGNVQYMLQYCWRKQSKRLKMTSISWFWTYKTQFTDELERDEAKKFSSFVASCC